MLKSLVFLSVVASFTMMACSNDKTEVKKEVTTTPAAAPEKSTTVIVDKNGVKVATQKVNVAINPDRKK
jgi:copper chaperone CopZ